MKIIDGAEFEAYRKNIVTRNDDEKTDAVVKEIIAAVRAEGDAAVRRFASRFDRSAPAQFEVPQDAVARSRDELRQ